MLAWRLVSSPSDISVLIREDEERHAVDPVFCAASCGSSSGQFWTVPGHVGPESDRCRPGSAQVRITLTRGRRSPAILTDVGQRSEESTTQQPQNVRGLRSGTSVDQHRTWSERYVHLYPSV